MINIYIKKKEKSQINNLTVTSKNYRKKKKRKEQMKPKVSRRKEITKITVEINEIDTLLARLTKKKKGLK